MRVFDFEGRAGALNEDAAASATIAEAAAQLQYLNCGIAFN
jgi:hypothetical protein